MIDMLGRFRAEFLIQVAQATRVGQAAQDQYEQMLDIWKGVAAGDQVDIDIDPRGRPITTSMTDFQRFVEFDVPTIEKYGYKLQ